LQLAEKKGRGEKSRLLWGMGGSCLCRGEGEGEKFLNCYLGRKREEENEIKRASPLQKFTGKKKKGGGKGSITFNLKRKMSKGFWRASSNIEKRRGKKGKKKSWSPTWKGKGHKKEPGKRGNFCLAGEEERSFFFVGGKRRKGGGAHARTEGRISYSREKRGRQLGFLKGVWGQLWRKDG